MATDNPFLNGMLGGMQLAMATEGARVNAQAQMLDTMMKFQQAQLQAEQQRDLFDLRRTEAREAYELNRLRIQAAKDESDARTRLAQIEAPVRAKELDARLATAAANVMKSNIEIENARVDTAAGVYSTALSASLYGIHDPTQARAAADQFFNLHAEKVGDDPVARRALLAARGKWEKDDMDRQASARADLAKLVTGFAEYAKDSGDPNATNALRELYKSQITDIGKRAGIDVAPVLSQFAQTGPVSAKDVLAQTGAAMQGSIPFAAPTTPEQERAAIDRESLSTRLDRMDAMQKSLLATYNASRDPAERSRLSEASSRLQAVRQATASGLPSIRRVPGSATMEARGLSASEADTLLASPSGDELLKFLRGVTNTGPQPTYPDYVPAMP